MSMQSLKGQTINRFKRANFLVQALILALIGITPLLTFGHASAAQLTNRTVVITTSEPDATGVDWDFEFDFAATAVQGMIFQFCDSPLGSCVKPTGLDVSNDLVSPSGQANFPNNGTAFAEVASNTGACSDTGAGSGVTMYCLNRTEATSGAGTNASLVVNDITNASVASTYTSVYVRITLFSDTAFATPVHDGTVAAVMTNQLTVSGRVQERLVFCVGALINGGSDPTSCATGDGFPTNTIIDIGVVDNSTIARSPVPTGTGTSANNAYGVAMVNTNATNGVVVSFFAEQALTGTEQLRSFRVTGATCDANAAITTDQCFVSASNTGDTFTAGTEMFGMQIPCITQTGTTVNLAGVPAGYNADGNTASVANCQDTGVDNSLKFGWNTTGVAQTLADSSSSLVKVVDDELIKIRFGATAAATTPTGVYSVVSTFIATATF